MPPIETHDLTKRYGRLTAVEGLDLSVDRREVLGFLGPNGAGKSTTIKMLVGLARPTRGRAVVGGHDVAEDGVRARASIGYVPEVVGLYGSMTARQFLRYTGRFYDLTGSEITRRAERLLVDVSLDQAASRKIATYSKGMRQRLALAAALLHDPEILILDEPLTGLDPEGVYRMRRAIRELGRERTIFLSSHELHAIEALCDRVAIIRKGQVIEQAPVDELLAHHAPLYRLELELETMDEGIEEVIAKVAGVEAVDLGDRANVFELELTDRRQAPGVLAALVERGLRVQAFAPRQASLEEVFVDLVGVTRR